MITEDKISVNYNELELSAFLSSLLDEAFMSPLEEFLSRPSKGIRYELVKSSFNAFKKNDEYLAESEELGLVLEALHAASLIVDDIQDGSIERREGPCLHVLEGVPKALNAGNWLYFWALRQIQNLNISEPVMLKMLNRINDTLFNGHLGQALDLSAPVTAIPKSQVTALCEATMRLKTGALMGLAIELGALLAGIEGALLQRTRGQGIKLGIILQMFDDLKNVKSVTDRKALEDVRNLRPSYLWSFTSKHCSDEEYAELIESVETLEHFQQCCTRLSLFERAFKEIEQRFQFLLSQVENKKLANAFEIQFTILKDAYEKS